MDSEKHTEFLNYFINKDKKYPERIYNLSPKKRDNEKANFRRLVKPFNVKNGTLYHGDVEAVTRDKVPGILKFVLGVYKFLGRFNTLILMFNIHSYVIFTHKKFT